MKESFSHDLVMFQDPGMPFFLLINEVPIGEEELYLVAIFDKQAQREKICKDDFLNHLLTGIFGTDTRRY